MGGEQAASVLHVVESDKRQREGMEWAAEAQEEFKRGIRDRSGVCWGTLQGFDRKGSVLV
jgi:hypothetical protein